MGYDTSTIRWRFRGAVKSTRLVWDNNSKTATANKKNVLRQEDRGPILIDNTVVPRNASFNIFDMGHLSC